MLCRKTQLQELRTCADEGKSISAELALEVLRSEPGDLPDILAAANAVRRRFFGDEIHLCSIVNAKCGMCAEDCAFCAQAADHQSDVTPFPLLEKDQIYVMKLQSCVLKMQISKPKIWI